MTEYDGVERSITECLRKLLDDRGVEYETYIEPQTGFEHVKWSFNEHGSADFNLEFGEPWLTMYGVVSGPDQAVEATLGQKVTGQTSDGYHTFDELYHHRAVLFSVIVRDHRELAWKSRKHHDGTMYEGMFIVGIDTPKGQATYHYDIDPYWDMFDCRELDRAPEWDGHTPDEAIARIATLRCRKTHTTEYCNRCEGAVLPKWKKCPWCGEPLEEV